MKKLSLFVVALLVVGTASVAAEKHPSSGGDDEYASDDGDREPASFFAGSFKAKHGPCSEIKLEDDQKAKLKEAFFKFREGKIDLDAQVKKARLNYEKLLANPSSDYKAAKAAAQDLSDSISKMIAAKQAFKAQVSFQILKPNQREPAMWCERQMKHRWAHKKHFGKDHDDHEDHHGDHHGDGEGDWG